MVRRYERAVLGCISGAMTLGFSEMTIGLHVGAKRNISEAYFAVMQALSP